MTSNTTAAARIWRQFVQLAWGIAHVIVSAVTAIILFVFAFAQIGAKHIQSVVEYAKR